MREPKGECVILMAMTRMQWSNLDNEGSASADGRVHVWLSQQQNIVDVVARLLPLSY